MKDGRIFKFPHDSLSSISFVMGDAPQRREFKPYNEGFSLGEVNSGSG